MADQSPTPIFDLANELAKREAEKPNDDPTKDTAIIFNVDAASPVKEIGVEVENKHEGEKVSWSIAGWFKNKFQKDGQSGGVKGKIEF